ncbi:MAG: 2'-deoxycytidine 5'-triphosphate deaminase [Patescibacteria group bacterium]
MSINQGALSSQMIHDLITKGHIVHANIKNIQPASLDLTLSEEVYRVDALFLPKDDEKVREAMTKVNPIRFARDGVYEVGVPYLARLNETLNLPSEIYAYANPKSTTGRNDVKVSLIVDGISRFDSAGKRGFVGELWAFIEPKSFRVQLPVNETLVQMRFFSKDTRISEEELPSFYDQHKILFDSSSRYIPYDALKISDRDGGVILTVNLKNDIVGYVCHGSHSVLDFAKRNHYDPADFFEPIVRPSKGMLFLRKGSFYILYTDEYVRVPTNFACEMAPVDIRNGEFRSHYAGFIDPGWGYGERGDVKGKPLVLEVRPFDDNIMIYHGQPICKLVFERMSEVPHVIYGAGSGSHYFSQEGPRLSKHFKIS